MKNIIIKFNKLYNTNKENEQNTNFGNILKITRQNKNYTQNDMAKILNCCGSYLSKIETGQITRPQEKVIDNFKLSFNEESKIYNLDNQENLYQEVLQQLYNHTFELDISIYLKDENQSPSIILLKFVNYVYKKDFENSYFYLERILDNKIVYKNQQEEIFYLTLINLLVVNLKFFDAYNILKTINKHSLNQNTTLILNLYQIIIEFFLFKKCNKIDRLLNIEVELVKNKFYKTLEYLLILKIFFLEYNENIFKYYFKNKYDLIEITNLKLLKLIQEKNIDKAHEIIIDFNKTQSNKESNLFKLLELIIYLKKGFISNFDFTIRSFKKSNNQSNFIENNIFELIKSIYETDTNLLKNNIKQYFEFDKINSIQSLLILEEILNLTFNITNETKKYKTFNIVYELFKEAENIINKSK